MNQKISGTIFLLLLIVHFPTIINAVKCIDCVGKNCVGKFCEGDYCMLAKYSPSWGSLIQFTIEPKIVTGCMIGKMFKKDNQSHCETIENNGEETSTCFCNNRDYCNLQKATEDLETRPIPLYTCACEGEHCKSLNCVGELCSFVINHQTKQIEKGCINASMPLIERRFVGSCMIPPATGALHHTAARNVSDLLNTESCICAGDYCNSDKLAHTQEENSVCTSYIQANIFGTKMISRNVTCHGEYCFKAQIDSEVGHLRSYSTQGCMSFIKHDELADEPDPSGCAEFHSTNLKVKACLKKDDFPKEDLDSDEIYKDDNAKTTRSYGRILPTIEEEVLTTTTPPFHATLPPAPDEKKSFLSNVFLFLIIFVGTFLIGIAYRYELHKRIFYRYY